MGKKTYSDYLKEIEELKEKYKVSSMECLTLQILASVKINKMNYDKMVKEIKG